MKALRKSNNKPRFVPTIRVITTCDVQFVDEDKVKFVNIEEGMQGEDILTFICPKCKQQHTSRRFG